MVQKKRSTSSDIDFGSLASRYGKALLLTLLRTFDNNLDDLPKKLSNIFHLRKTVVRVIVCSIFLLVSVFLFLNGLSTLITFVLPGSLPGISQMVIGFIVLVLIYAYTKYI